jgi:hypothetical protein
MKGLHRLLREITIGINASHSSGMLGRTKLFNHLERKSTDRFPERNDNTFIPPDSIELTSRLWRYLGWVDRQLPALI